MIGLERRGLCLERAVPGIPFPVLHRHITSTEHRLGPASRLCSPSRVFQNRALASWLAWAEGSQHSMLVNVSWKLLPALILLVPGL